MIISKKNVIPVTKFTWDESDQDDLSTVTVLEPLSLKELLRAKPKQTPEGNGVYFTL